MTYEERIEAAKDLVSYFSARQVGFVLAKLLPALQQGAAGSDGMVFFYILRSRLIASEFRV
jgi:hypothetical protein